MDGVIAFCKVLYCVLSCLLIYLCTRIASVFLNLLIQCTLSKNYQILVHCTNNQVLKTFFNGKEINASVHVVEDFIVRIVILFCCFIFYSYSKNILYFLVRLMNKKTFSGFVLILVVTINDYTVICIFHVANCVKIK